MYDVKYQKTITTNYYTTDRAHGTYYIVTVIQSNGGKPAIFPEYIKLIDSAGREFDYDISSDWEATSDLKYISNQVRSSMLNPGGADIFIEVFDIPKDVKITHLQVTYLEHID